MLEAVVDYSLFAAKLITVLLGIGLLLVALLRVRRASSRMRPDDADDDGTALELVDLGERYRTMADTVRHAILPRRAYRRAVKEERKAERARSKSEQPRRRVFVIDFDGDIMATEVASLREMVSALLIVAKPDDEVLVRLENTGGAVAEHGLAAAQLQRLRARDIPLTVAVDKVAASGGYLMASVANRVLAAPFAVIGSIGVLAELPNFHRLLERHGIDFELHTAGEHKRTITLFGENNEAGRAKLREQLEAIHELFKGFIREQRGGLDVDQVATGEYWHGRKAKELGLVDEVCTSDEYLLAACDEADVFKLRYRVKKAPIDRLLAAMRLSWSALEARAWAALEGSAGDGSRSFRSRRYR
jgi:serine protease SohB